ncbi:MAG: response regulator transcription factor [Nitrospira sp.]
MRIWRWWGKPVMEGQPSVSAAALKPDVVVMDVDMPKIDGIEATRHIISEHPDVVVIGLSVQNERHIEEAMLKAGAAVFHHRKKNGPPASSYEAIVSTVATPGK